MAVMKPLVGVGGEERSVERIDMSRIDGEELSPEELPQVAHKCGANAWRWRVREWRPNPRGLPLGNFNALEERSEVSGSRAEEPEVEEDPDMEDFAFFAGLTETTGEPEACELEVRGVFFLESLGTFGLCQRGEGETAGGGGASARGGEEAPRGRGEKRGEEAED
ncbi:Hypothetical protein (Fragment) [Durusdinium trenchii]|uniref:Uncharacterized protein n=1 Tax=Durusdinium trenchii TaxID=1381693 RepID=A0ABP0MXN7_9DINO